jgi:AI-2E family transporter
VGLSGLSASRISGQSRQPLRRWLLGQLIAMLLVFVLTGLGLWAIGVPAALALALLAGFAEFIPLVGPVVAAIPALLIAPSGGLQPVMQHRLVSLPPAVTLFAVVGSGLLSGSLGVLLATARRGSSSSPSRSSACVRRSASRPICQAGKGVDRRAGPNAWARTLAVPHSLHPLTTC